MYNDWFDMVNYYITQFLHISVRINTKITPNKLSAACSVLFQIGGKLRPAWKQNRSDGADNRI